MYTSYYGLSCNPFLKEVKVENRYESEDYIQLTARLNYLKEIKGIGVFTGTPGLGKTFTIRCFIESLNKDLYKVIYISASDNITVFDFFKELGTFLNIDTGSCFRTDLYKNIQKEIIRLVKVDKIEPIIIIDDAQNLSREILQNLKILFDFEVDSKDYATVILVGQAELIDEINKNIYESLKQRIVVNYQMKGLSRDEVKEYIKTRLSIANVENTVFQDDALNALYSCSKSSPRRLNRLILNSFMIGFQNRVNLIDSSIIMEAKGELDLL